MQIRRVNNLDFAVADEGDGAPLVLLHAFPLDHTVWSDQIAAFAGQYRVIAPDLRGFGRSGATPGKVTVEQLANDVNAMLDALRIDEPVVLGGLSMGGYVAMQFRRSYCQRVRALIFCDTRAAADTPQAATGRLETAERLEREGVQFLAESMLPRLLCARTLQSSEEIVAHVEQTILRGSATGFAAAARGLAERADFAADLPHIACPTLLVVGRHDAISTPASMAAMAQAIPGAILVEIDDAGHLSPMEQPVEVTRAIRDFLHEAVRR